MYGIIHAVARHSSHCFSKEVVPRIHLLAGEGVEGDAHCGVLVKHRSRVKANPHQPNLRQVHLIHAELLDELKDKSFSVNPGELGENILTVGIDFLNLPKDTRLQLGTEAIVQITGLRNPCSQLNDFLPGLMEAVLERKPDGTILRKCGIMAIVLRSGTVQPGDAINIELPPLPHITLDRV